jgi:hypothetical protein
MEKAKRNPPKIEGNGYDWALRQKRDAKGSMSLK